jgi:hypothetical protein
MIAKKIFQLYTFVCICSFSGCVTDDFNDLAKGFSPISPKQAALMASDQHSPDERRVGITLLATSSFGGAQPYVTMYRDYVVADGDALVRAAAIKALARYAKVEDAELIVPWLQREGSNSVQVRREAALALQRIHNPAVVSNLLISLGDVNEEAAVRTYCATALGQYPEDQVIVGLIASLDANELSVNLAAAQSLHILTGQSFEIDRYAWFSWYKKERANAKDLFEGMTYFEYPTYQHEPRWWDRFVFWEQRNEEKPSVPVGLEDPTRRSTYDDATHRQ